MLSPENNNKCYSWGRVEGQRNGSSERRYLVGEHFRCLWAVTAIPKWIVFLSAILALGLEQKKATLSTKYNSRKEEEVRKKGTFAGKFKVECSFCDRKKETESVFLLFATSTEPPPLSKLFRWEIFELTVLSHDFLLVSAQVDYILFFPLLFSWESRNSPTLVWRFRKVSLEWPKNPWVLGRVYRNFILFASFSLFGPVVW